MSERFGEAQLPIIEIVDLKEAHKRKAMKGLFSPQLYTAMDRCLHEGKQIILFQNRRGYAPLLECYSCGHIPQCTNCDVSLTYHQYNQQLRCHYCYHFEARSCVVCSSPNLEVKGTGTQQIEEQVQQYFPAAPVERIGIQPWKTRFEGIIDPFSSGEVRVLVGTKW